MDPFEVRIQFISNLKKLNASQQSIQKCVGYALKYYPRCGEDLWSCIIDECRDGSLNTRINVLYLLDTLCESSFQTSNNDRAQGRSISNGTYYVDYISRDLDKIVEHVVPDSKDGLMNIQSTSQILENWRIKRIIDAKSVENAIAVLENRKESIQQVVIKAHGSRSGASQPVISRNEVVKRIEEDRERHKRLRERRWVQQIDRSEHNAQTLASFLPFPQPLIQLDADESQVAMEVDDSSEARDSQGPVLPIDIEFENAWETTSDWNEDDVEAVTEEDALCFSDKSANATLKPVSKAPEQPRVQT